MANSEFTLGVDPEIFVTQNGKPISAHGLIPGDKKNPHPTEGGAVQVDGMALEFNTEPVSADNFEKFNALIVGQIAQIRAMIPDNLSLRIEPIAEFTKEHMDAQPDVAKELGCDPDYNAYTMKQNPRPDADDVLFRSGAGHIHIGWGADIPVENEEHIAICSGFVKMLDATIGMFMTVVDREPRRRELYGKAGAFRPKPYGVEYRTPSNVWIKNKDYRYLVHFLVNRALTYSKAEYTPPLITSLTEAQIIETINTGNVKQAMMVLDRIFGGNRKWLEVRKGLIDG